jgi:RNA polymerase sigma-70 factor (ECF subfamily)
MESRFATTSWTKVLAARTNASTESRHALEVLCRTYWYPLYAFVRRLGHDPDAARDLTQSYFAELLEKGYLEDYDPSRGRFRVFLKASLKNFLSKEREKDRTWKRGGRTEVLSLDTPDVESRYRHEPVDKLTPEEIFERRWALTVLEQALGQLRREQQEGGRGREFARLEGFLTGLETKTPYREVAAELGTSESVVKTTVHRLRERFGEVLRTEISDTVSSPDQVDDEVKHLLGVIAPWARPPS